MNVARSARERDLKAVIFSNQAMTSNQSQPELSNFGSDVVSIDQVPDCHKDVALFLHSLNLMKYLPKFVAHRIEDLDTVLELRDHHLDAMDLPLGFKLKIIKRIKEVRE